MWLFSRFASVTNPIQSASELSVYPNPAAGNSNWLGISVLIGGMSQLELTDEIGRTILSEKKMLNAGLNPNALEIKSLRPGMYFLELRQNGRMMQTKLSVQ